MNANKVHKNQLLLLLFCTFLGLSWPRTLLHAQSDLKTSRSTSLGIRALNVLARQSLFCTFSWFVSISHGPGHCTPQRVSPKEALGQPYTFCWLYLCLNCHLLVLGHRWCSCFKQNKMVWFKERNENNTKKYNKASAHQFHLGTVPWCTAKSERHCKSKFGAFSAKTYCI